MENIKSSTSFLFFFKKQIFRYTANVAKATRNTQQYFDFRSSFYWGGNKKKSVQSLFFVTLNRISNSNYLTIFLHFSLGPLKYLIFTIDPS